MPLYLVGFMGVGKTRLGRIVSERTGSPFVDLDHQVEAAAGMPTKAVFERWGETYFRDLEHCCLRMTESLGSAIVATGGGTFTFERNRQIIEKLGTSLWIDLDFDSIIGRMSERGRRARPLLADENRARALWQARQPVYGAADLRVGVRRGEPAGAVAGRILHMIREKNCVI